MKNGLTVASFTHVGKRSNNEDNLFIKKISDFTVCAVADGMGGAVAGEKASKIAVDSLAQVVLEKKNSIKKEDLSSVFAITQQNIASQISKDTSLQGMGTTLTCLVFNKGKYFWGNLGDSRIYRIRNSVIKRLTVDHSYIEDYKQNHKGQIDSSIVSKYGNYLTRSLDGGTDEPDISPSAKPYRNARLGDIFLLCSDGLILEKDNEEQIIIKIILKEKNLDSASKLLAQDAIRRGSKDNVTIVLLEYGKHKRLKGKIQYFKHLKIKTSIIILAAAIVFSLLIASLYILNDDQNQNGQNRAVTSGEKIYDRKTTSGKDNEKEWKNPLQAISSPNIPVEITPYPLPQELKHYKIRVESENQKVINFTFRGTSFKLNDVNGLILKEGQEYDITLIAVLNNGKEVEGNTQTY